jgi:hypothetical protein
MIQQVSVQYKKNDAGNQHLKDCGHHISGYLPSVKNAHLERVGKAVIIDQQGPAFSGDDIFSFMERVGKVPDRPPSAALETTEKKAPPETPLNIFR